MNEYEEAVETTKERSEAELTPEPTHAGTRHTRKAGFPRTGSFAPR